MSRFLYRSPKGYEVTAHSYSAGNLYECPAKYKYFKVMGYSSRDDRVQLEFGKVVEAGIVWFENSNREPGSGVLEFQKLWRHYEHDSSIVYSQKTGDWQDHYQVGTELLRLYEVLAPSLPIGEHPQFQINYKKELFPDTEYSGLEWQGFLDVITEVRYDHPKLPPLPYIPETGMRKLVIDIKTSSLPYFTDQRFIKLDGQLRQYAWASEIETQTFLVLVKNRSKLSSGEKVTLLKDYGSPMFDEGFLQAGSEYYTLDVTPEVVVLLKHQTTYDDYIKERDDIKGTGSKEKKEELLGKYVLQYGFRVRREDVTKQKIQFLAAIIPEEDRLEAGELVGREAISISDAFQTDNFPKKPGVRFPNQVCTNCEALGLCLGDEEMTKQRLIKIDGVY